MNYLWSMINCQQLMMVFTLYKINFPANALTFFQLLIVISTFDIIPIEDSSIKALDLEDESPFNE